MNKKGFTLVEVLAIVVVLVMIVLVAVPSLIGTINTNEQVAYKSKIEDIILAASSFNSVYNGRIKQVSLSDLKKYGYIIEVVNPIDNSIMNGCVYINSGEYIYDENPCTTIYSE